MRRDGKITKSILGTRRGKQREGDGAWKILGKIFPKDQGKHLAEF
jgi:hypothetical protein